MLDFRIYPKFFGILAITVPKGTKVLKGTAAQQTIKNAAGEVIESRAGGSIVNGIIEGSKITGTAANGLKFEGWIDSAITDATEVKNFYPIIN